MPCLLANLPLRAATPYPCLQDGRASKCVHCYGSVVALDIKLTNRQTVHAEYEAARCRDDSGLPIESGGTLRLAKLESKIGYRVAIKVERPRDVGCLRKNCGRQGCWR